MSPAWKKLALSFSFAAFVVATGSCGGDHSVSTSPSTPADPGTPNVTLTTFVSGLSNPVGFVPANDGSGRFFVLEQSGRIRIIQNGVLLATPFLDISQKIESGGEKGLLGLAFHPQFIQNGRFFLNYTRRVAGQLQSVIAEYTVSPTNTNQTSSTSERALLTLNQPFDNHKGGQLAFGPDGFLYLGFGDGGSGGDPMGNGQDKFILLGKILRIDVNTISPGKQYGIPPDNPFVASGGTPEVWAYGFRNPWRFSFDSSGRLFAGDVGQDKFEEIDIVVKGGNYGWNIMEGLHCFNASTCNQSGLILPITEYDHTAGDITVIGGYVYRGTSIPQLQGAYIFGDFGSGRIWILREGPPGTWIRTLLLSSGKSISSFGQDVAGEIYVVDYSGGGVLKLVAQ
jgi:glucose/arabinose dehydrogenase